MDRYREKETLLDHYEPDIPPSQRYNRIVDVEAIRVLELRDHNHGLGDKEDAPRYQYLVVTDGQLWTRNLPPESVGDEWSDIGAPRWYPHPRGESGGLLAAWLREAEPVRLLIVRREAVYIDGAKSYVIRGEMNNADGNDVAVVAGPILGSMWDVPLPPCPDCGGDLGWYEAGNVPGTRRCMGSPIGDSLEAPTYDVAGGCGSVYTIV